MDPENVHEDEVIGRIVLTHVVDAGGNETVHAKLEGPSDSEGMTRFEALLIMAVGLETVHDFFRQGQS